MGPPKGGSSARYLLLKTKCQQFYPFICISAQLTSAFLALPLYSSQWNNTGHFGWEKCLFFSIKYLWKLMHFWKEQYPIIYWQSSIYWNDIDVHSVSFISFGSLESVPNPIRTFFHPICVIYTDVSLSNTCCFYVENLIVLTFILLNCCPTPVQQNDFDLSCASSLWL